MTDDSAVAIVGLSGRFPGAASIEEYWANLRDGVCSITDFTEAELLAGGVGVEELRNPNYVPSKGVLRDADRFEAQLFGFNRTEATALDPQHRLLLETAWGALEDAGYSPRTPPARTGVYVGGTLSEHLVAAYTDPRLAAELGTWQVKMLTDKDYLATWISYRLGLTGPSMTVQTACSTSLTAVHVATQALLLGECDTALAGGVCVDSIRTAGYLYYEGGIRSPDGRCRPFDENAAGTLGGNGVGLVVLRRLADALADGDPVRAVIRGTAVTNDGAGKVGFSAPSVGPQTAAIVEAWAAADLHPASAQYLEMHGTATALGDRIELSAAAAALEGTAPGRCGIGSVKSNIGHLDSAAGIAGLAKVVLMLQHRQLAPTVNVSRPHPDLAATPFRLVDRLASWDAPASGPRRAGVSALGVGGTNVHVVLEEAPEARSPAGSAERGVTTLLPIAARTHAQVAATARQLAAALQSPTPPTLDDVAYTLQVGRAPLRARGYVVAANRSEAVAALTALGERGATATGREDGTDGRAGGATGPDAPVYLFPGQASEYADVGAGLYEAFPVFRRELDACARILLGRHGIDPRPWRVPDAAGTRYWQPTLVSLQYSLARLWQGVGVTPAAMVGHSIGEYAAACLAGVLTIEAALSLAAVRGELMEGTEPGRMLAVALSEADVQAAGLLGQGVALAAVNGPRACVLSGPEDAIAKLAAHLTDLRAAHRYLGVQRAFHSGLMEPILDAFADQVARVALTPPRLRYVSTVTGEWATAEQVTDPAYWVDQIRQPVRYRDAVATAGAHAPGPLLELGPGNLLSGQARRVLPGRVAIPTMGGESDGEAAATWRALGEIWSLGVEVTWPAPSTARRIHLPTYPFAGRSHGALTPTVLPAIGATAVTTTAGAASTPPPVPRSTGSGATGSGSEAVDPTAEPRPAAPSTDDRTAGSASGDAAGTAPAGTAIDTGTGTGTGIAEVLISTLGLSGPGDLTMSYFEAGGDSLAAVHIVGRLRDELGIEIPVVLLLEQVTLGELATRIGAVSSERDEDDLLEAILSEIESENATD